MKPETELVAAIDDARARVLAHPGWRSGSLRAYTLLETATRLRQMEIENLGTTLPPWETVLGLLISWHHQVPISNGVMTHDDAAEIVLAAAHFAQLDNLQLSIRMGSYRVRKTRDHFVVTPRWDTAIEVADAILERATAPPDIPEPSATEQRWIADKPAASRKPPPTDVLRAAAARSRLEIEAWRAAKPEGALPEHFPIGEELTIGDAIEILAGLMGLADLSHFTATDQKRTEATLIHRDRPGLIDLLHELAPTCTRDQVDVLVERLTYEPGRLVRNSPLVHLDGVDVIIACPPLISSRLVDAIVLRSAAYNPGRFGPIGVELGKQAARWADWLTSIPGVLVATEVKMFTHGRTQAGDLDVVAVDPEAKTVLCMEIKWPIDAWHLTEVDKSERQMASACHQLAKRRGQLMDGSATARFPREWPDLSGFTWTWAVGLPQQLCLTPSPEPDIHVTSLQFALALGTPPDLAAVIRTLRHPALPEPGVDFSVKRLTVPLSRRSIHVDALAIDPNTKWWPVFS